MERTQGSSTRGCGWAKAACCRRGWEGSSGSKTTSSSRSRSWPWPPPIFWKVTPRGVPPPGAADDNDGSPPDDWRGLSLRRLPLPLVVGLVGLLVAAFSISCLWAVFTFVFHFISFIPFIFLLSCERRRATRSSCLLQIPRHKFEPTWRTKDLRIPIEQGISFYDLQR